MFDQAGSMNKVLLDGVIIEISETRYSPAGVPKTKVILHHQSRQPEGQQLKSVECKVTVQLIGAEHDPSITGLKVGNKVRIQGFLLRNSYREDQSWLKVQALSVDKLNTQDQDMHQSIDLPS